MTSNFTVLMSLYIKEKAEYFDECMKSVLSQTVLPNEIVIVLDGPISEALEDKLVYYEKNNPNLIKRIPLEKNVGLGLALREGILHCSNEIIARMDTDDIARNDRFEIQLKEFEKNPNLDICGSHIIEFEGCIDNVLSYRDVPLTHDEISKYQKQRSAFNHMTVMYKKSSVLKAGNYQHAPLMEDDLLWINMLISGAICANINDYLVYARTGIEMISRRGGWSYYKKYKNGRKIIRKTKYISYWDYKKTVMIQFVVALIPRKLRLRIFLRFLRNKKK